jgi:glycine C-acetyltransferase
MRTHFYDRITTELAEIDQAGLTKPERVLTSPQGASVTVKGRTAPVLNLCANNYLGLAADPRVIEAAREATAQWGAGLASVRFICGSQQIHKDLEAAIADYLGFEDSILFAAAFDANGGVFEPLLGEEDAIVSDSLNHASIIDGVRLCKARRFRFANGDMDGLEQALKEARQGGARTIVIATDGVFSMDGSIARLAEITALADAHDALVLVDDCHATGFLGTQGRGTAAYRGVEGRIDILTGTFGKALGGAMGGFVAARRSVVDLLRQRARPYLFSNALAPAICGASLAAITITRSAEGDALRDRLFENAVRFRSGMATHGFELLAGEHPIIPVMLHDAARAQAMAARLLDAGIYVTGFSFPVVPKGQARIRTQMSAAHTPEQIDRAITAFAEVGRALEIIA